MVKSEPRRGRAWWPIGSGINRLISKVLQLDFLTKFKHNGFLADCLHLFFEFVRICFNDRKGIVVHGDGYLRVVVEKRINEKNMTVAVVI